MYVQSYNGCVLLHHGILVRRVCDKNTACINDIMGKEGAMVRAPILGLPADKDPRSHGVSAAGEFAGSTMSF